MFALTVRLVLVGVVVSLVICVTGIGWGGQREQDIIAFLRQPDTSTGISIYLMDVASHVTVQLTRTTQHHRGLVWSPDGSRLAYTVTEAEGGSSVRVMDADGRNQRVLTSRRLEDFYQYGPYGTLVWTPDSQRLIFSRNASPSYGSGLVIYSVRADGSDFKIVTQDDADGQYYLPLIQPSFYPSPDGRKQAYIDYQDNAWGLFVITGEAPAKRVLPLIGDEVYIENTPTWAPDSQRMALMRLTALHPEIYVLNVETGHTERLTYGGASNPVWYP